MDVRLTTKAKIDKRNVLEIRNRWRNPAYMESQLDRSLGYPVFRGVPPGAAVRHLSWKTERGETTFRLRGRDTHGRLYEVEYTQDQQPIMDPADYQTIAQRLLWRWYKKSPAGLASWVRPDKPGEQTDG